MRKKNPSFPDLFLLLVAINVVLISAATYFYNGGYIGLFHYFSFVGEFRTQTGSSNLLSMTIFGLDMVITGLLLLVFAQRYFHRFGPKVALFKSINCSLAGLGFIFTGVFPDDINHRWHVFGAGMAIAFLWLAATGYLIENRKKVKPAVYYSVQSALQIPIAVYAGTYFMRIEPTSFILQKLALFGLSIALVSTHFIKTRRVA